MEYQESSREEETFKMKNVEPALSRISIPVDGTWTIDDWFRLMRAIRGIYNALYTVSVVEEGQSFEVLRSRSAGSKELQVVRIQFASPGEISLSGLSDVIQILHGCLYLGQYAKPLAKRLRAYLSEEASPWIRRLREDRRRRACLFAREMRETYSLDHNLTEIDWLTNRIEPHLRVLDELVDAGKLGVIAIDDMNVGD